MLKRMVKFNWTLIFILFYIRDVASNPESNCRIASCREIYLRFGKPPSGNYTVETLSGASVSVYCDFYEDRGYTFIRKDDLHLVSEADLDALYTVNDHIMVRILYTNGSQHDITMEQLSEFRGYALGFRLSNSVGYNPLLNQALAPYLYVGFLPQNLINMTGTRQGYSAGGVNFTFNSCDGNPNSYLAIFQNPGGNPENNYYTSCCDFPHINHWINRSQPIPNDKQMTEEFYYQYEIHMGGCGGYLSTKSKEGIIDGVSIGLGFEMNKCSATCVAKYCGCRRRGRSNCRIPGACIVTRVKILRDYSGGYCRIRETYGIEMGSVWTSGGCQGMFWVCFDDGCSSNAITPDGQTINYEN